MAKSPNIAAVDALAREITAAVRALPRRDTAAVRAVRRDYSRRLANEPPGYVLAIAFKLLDEPDPLFRWFAYELVHFHRATLRALRAKHLAQLGRGLGRWEDVDTFAPYLAGPAWREGQVSDALIQRWARSKD